MKYEAAAHDFCEAIKDLAKNEDNLNNFESYLSQHFEYWLEKYASTPNGLASEMMLFASMVNNLKD